MFIRVFSTIVVVFAVLTSLTFAAVETNKVCPSECNAELGPQLWFQALGCLFGGFCGLAASLFYLATSHKLPEYAGRFEKPAEEVSIAGWSLLMGWCVLTTVPTLVYIGFSASDRVFNWQAIIAITIFLHADSLLLLAWLWYPYRHLKCGSRANDDEVLLADVSVSKK